VRSDRKRPPVLITDAPEDPEKELRRREVRYVTMMLTRAACLIAAAILVTMRPPLWPLWIALCVVGAVLLPWLAVILANDRPPKTKAERAAAKRRFYEATPALPSHGPDRVVDVDDFEVSENDRRTASDAERDVKSDAD
jgi:Protein of unknown function (DUF3099)